MFHYAQIPSKQFLTLFKCLGVLFKIDVDPSVAELAHYGKVVCCNIVELTVEQVMDVWVLYS